MRKDSLLNWNDVGNFTSTPHVRVHVQVRFAQPLYYASSGNNIWKIIYSKKVIDLGDDCIQGKFRQVDGVA